MIDQLNENQKKAVLSESKNILILAGAGTGKTKTITTRIIYLIEELKVNQKNILALTFTNKAAREMRERVNAYFQNDTYVSFKTFHSFGVTILREFAGLIGRNRYFNIYDDDDSNKVISKILKEFGYETMNKIIKNDIRKYKQSVEAAPLSNQYDFYKVYKKYNQILRDGNSFDFEDLILEPVKIIRDNHSIKQQYNDKYKYILVDEYQDTNVSQFELLINLCDEKTNLMVVGDEDQSIYKFRGADVTNIINFQNCFNNSTVIKLEENYRSTNEILTVADCVIKNNTSRLGKSLYTNVNGDKVKYFCCENDIKEAEEVAKFIIDNSSSNEDTAVLYRTNSQSRVLEAVFMKYKIPYKIMGSASFFQREEIKDCIAVLKWIVNPKDKVAFERFINKPARGIGKKTLEKIYRISEEFDNDILKTIENIDSYKNIIKKTEPFILVKNVFKDCDISFLNDKTDSVLLNVLNGLGIIDYYNQYDIKNSSDKVYNIKEFLIYIVCKNSDIISLLEQLTLEPIKNEEENKGVKLLTIHNAKGLEFDTVFITGLEENLFPHSNSLIPTDDGSDDIEEERRLFYVGITRAKRELILSYCRKRNIFGEIKNMEKSRFIDEISPGYLINISKEDENQIYNKFSEIKIGTMVRHKDYGCGKILNKINKNNKCIAVIDFYDYSIMEFILEFTRLEIVE